MHISPIIALLAVVSLSAAACDRRGSVSPEPMPPMPEQAIERFTVTETEGGKPHWTLDAENARILEKEQRALLNSPHVRFFENGEHVSTLTAERGRVNMENYDIWGEGQCFLDTVKGEHLQTRNLRYDSSTKKILTDEQVTLVRPNEVIRGLGMEATPDLENIIIKKQRVELKK